MPVPRVTILMSVYNAARYLGKAIDSILNQTFGDFEFVIINDGSTDGSRDILDGIRDTRVRLFHTANRGLAAALEHGVRESRAPYLARMDADDMAVSQRLSVQVAYLDQHPDVGVVTGDYVAIDADDSPIRTSHASDGPLIISWKLLWENPICHPSVMMRRDVLLSAGVNYDPLCTVEDYDVWTRLLFHTRFAHLGQVLLHYRLNATGMTGTRDRRQLDATSRIQQRTLSTLLGRTLDPQVGRSVALLSRQTVFLPTAADNPLDAAALVGLGREVRQAFERRFEPSSGDQSKIDSDLAARYLSWGFLLSRVPGRSRDATGVLMREALSLAPHLLFDRRLRRNVVGRCVGPETWLRLRSKFGRSER